jgi:hypothetical protein
MLDNPNSSTRSTGRAKPRSAAKPAAVATDPATTLFKALLSLGGLSDAAAAAAWGRDRRGLIPALSDGFNLLFPNVGLLRRDGKIVGFSIASGGIKQVMDYTDPGSIQAGRSVLQPSNLNLARRTRGSPEEALARALRYPDKSIWDALAAGIGVTVNPKRTRVSYRSATRLASAVVNEGIHNSVGHAKLGALAVTLTFPPSLRAALLTLSTRPATPTTSAMRSPNSQCSRS